MKALTIIALLPLALLAACGSAAGELNHDTMAGMAATADTGRPSLAVDSAQRRRLGIMTVVARTGDLVREVRLVGRVVPAETARRTVTAKIDGFVERLYVDFTGREVRRGEPLMDIYSPMLVAAQEELLLAVRLRRSLGTDASAEARLHADSLVAASRRRLRFWDIDSAQVAELERSGAATRTLTLRAPVDGVVLEKNVVQGQAIMASVPLLEIADLRQVWLEADAFETDIGLLRTGLMAEVEFDAYPGDRFGGRLTYVYPTLDPVSRTGRVRIELDNTRGRVRPGLFGSVRIVAPAGQRGVLIPRQAALVTGDRQLVFVEDSAGRLAPRLVQLGAESDSLVLVRSGLAAGERVVAAAAFLLDAESNLGEAMAGMAGMDMGGSPTPAPTPRRAAPPAARDTAKSMPGMPGMPMPEHQHEEN